MTFPMSSDAATPAALPPSFATRPRDGAERLLDDPAAPPHPSFAFHTVDVPSPMPEMPPGIPIPDSPAVPPEGDPPTPEPPITDPGKPAPMGDPAPGAAMLGRVHARRLREMYRSAGWPCCDAIEVDLLAAGMLERVRSALGHETLRVTDLGIAHIAGALVVNRGAMSAHEALVEQVAREMTRNGRIAWRGLSLRARVPVTTDDPGQAMAAVPAPGGLGLEPQTDLSTPPNDAVHGDSRRWRWCIARPDVFSIRNTSVEAYAQPIVHEVKVRRADLMADLRKPDKRAAYLDLGGECWYVLGNDARGRCIASPDEVPPECGVMVLEAGRLVVARAAVHRPLPRMPFPVWLALAKARPVAGFDEDAQSLLTDGPLGIEPLLPA